MCTRVPKAQSDVVLELCELMQVAVHHAARAQADCGAAIDQRCGYADENA